MNNIYYLSMKVKLLKEFDRASGWFKPHLIEHFGTDTAEVIRKEAKNEYEALIPQILYIGGTKVHRCNPRMKRGRQTEWRLDNGD